MAAGSIIVDLLMKTGAFETDTDRASKKLKQLEKDINKAASAMGATLGVAVIGAAVAFDQLIKSVADFKDFEEIAGAPAEEFASLSLAAAAAGVSMDSIVASTVKLTKGLSGVEDESDGVGAALKSIGIEIEAFKKLNPVEQYEAIGKALGEYEDSAKKTAVAVTLLGKSGAEQLKVFKALEEAGGRQVTLTQKQIEAADAYADAQAVAVAELKIFGQVAASEFLPVVTDILNAFSELVKGIEFSQTAMDVLRFAFDAALTVFQTVAVIGSDVAFVLTTIGKEAGAAAAQIAALARGDMEGFKAISKAVEEDIKRARAELDKFQASIMGAGQPRAGANDYGDEEYGASRTKKQNTFEGPDKRAEKAKAAREKAAKEAADIAQRQAEAEEQWAQDTAEAWGYWQQYRVKESEVATEAMAEQWKQIFAEIDAEQERAIEEGKAYLEAKVDEISEFQKQAMHNLQDFLGSSLEDVLSGNFDNIEEAFAKMVRKMAAEALAAQLNEKLFGKDGTSGLFGSLISSIAGGFTGGSTGGGSSFAYTDSSGGFSMVPGYATGTNYVPEDGLAMLHKGEAVVPKQYNPSAGAPSAGNNTVQIINNGAPVNATSTTERQPDGKQLTKIILDTIEQDIRAGGKVSKMQQNTFGLKRQLPRR